MDSMPTSFTHSQPLKVTMCCFCMVLELCVALGGHFASQSPVLEWTRTLQTIIINFSIDSRIIYLQTADLDTPYNMRNHLSLRNTCLCWKTDTQTKYALSVQRGLLHSHGMSWDDWIIDHYLSSIQLHSSAEYMGSVCLEIRKGLDI